MFSILEVILLFGASAFAKNINAVINEEDPLNLTPLIERGEAARARTLSAVDPALFAGVKSHAAYITVNQTNKWNTFFWFFPAQDKPLSTAPWIVWLQGGPGVSSMYGLFTEIGPLEIKNGSASRMPVTWNSDYSLLFIDNPVNVGFSYSEIEDKYMTNEDEVGRSLLSLVQQLVQVFPELQKAPLFIAGESYAGKYIPAFGHYLHHHHNNSAPINLTGLIIGDGYTDPPTLLNYSDLALQLGFIQPEEAATLKTLENDIREYWKKGNIEEFQKKINVLQWLVSQKVPNVYNYLENYDDGLEGKKEFVPYLARTDVRSSLHVGKRNYAGSVSWIVHNQFTDENFITVKPWLEELLEHYPVLCYSGQLDFIVGYALSVNTYRSLNWTGAQAYLQAPRLPIKSDRPGETLDIIGYTKGAGNFMEVLIRAAGHMAPADQPLAAKQVIDMFIRKHA